GADTPSTPSPIFIFHTDAVARFFHSDGTAAGPAFHLTGGFPENDPQDDNAVVPAAMAVAPDGSGAIASNCFRDQSDTFLQRFTRDGTVSDLELVPADCTCFGDPATDPSLAMAPDGSFIVAWTNGHGVIGNFAPTMVRARHFAADGTGLGDVFQV